MMFKLDFSFLLFMFVSYLIKEIMETTRRKFLSTASLSSLGLVAAATTISSIIPAKAQADTMAASKVQ